MSALLQLLRGGVALAGVLALLLGALSLGVRFAPDHPSVTSAHETLLGVPLEAARRAQLPAPEALVAHPFGPLGLAGAALAAIGLLAVTRRRSPAAGRTPAAGLEGELPGPPRGRARRKLERQARRLARDGHGLEAAELLLDAGLPEAAAGFFAEADEPVRAAELLHDQNRFLEAAELFAKAGRLESAGEVFAGQEEWGRAAECFLEAGKPSVAAEMFEKAGDARRAGDCYLEAGFERHAARAYVRCQAWENAAEALESVLAEETRRTGTGQDARREQELRTLVRQTAKLWEESGMLSRALPVLERGGCPAEAAEVALRLEEWERAAELFRSARDAPRAADALRRAGREEDASLLLAEHHRDRGEDEEAAALFEQAGDWSSAADLYRKLEAHARAGACYERNGERAAAAEMYRAAGDWTRAAQCYEAVGEFAEAAACAGELGDGARHAELLEKAGDALAAGRAWRTAGREGEAVRALQRVEPDAPESPAAAALLGEVFREKGMHSLAIKKLREAVSDQQARQENVEVFYTLATLCEDRGALDEAVDLYERILACDYHFRDAAERLQLVRERARSAPARDDARMDPGQTAAPARYQVIEELGRGGMGIVYKARDTVLDRLVAYKVLPESLRENSRALRNFLREAKSAAQLNHPNIVTVYDAGEQDGRFYIAMEYVDGTTLKTILRRRGVIPARGVLHIAVQMAQALAYAHERKIVHRDVKTANTMWTRDRKAKIMDFGLAKVVEEVRNHTTIVSGTPYYMSPEQTLGRNVDHRTDLYSLGVTLFEMATGRLPFREGNVPYHHVHTRPPDPRELAPDLPELLVRIILRCLEKDPERRPASALELLDEVRAARRSET